MKKVNEFRNYWEDQRRYNRTMVDSDIRESKEFFLETTSNIFKVLKIEDEMEQHQLLKNNYDIALERFQKELNNEENTPLEELYKMYVSVKGAYKLLMEF